MTSGKSLSRQETNVQNSNLNSDLLSAFRAHLECIERIWFVTICCNFLCSIKVLIKALLRREQGVIRSLHFESSIGVVQTEVGSHEIDIVIM